MKYPYMFNKAYCSKSYIKPVCWSGERLFLIRLLQRTDFKCLSRTVCQILKRTFVSRVHDVKNWRAEITTKLCISASRVKVQKNKQPFHSHLYLIAFSRRHQKSKAFSHYINKQSLKNTTELQRRDFFCYF